MLNLPLLKFEKSSNYLKNQLQAQTNNKQLILDIITNIGLLINNSSNEELVSYQAILDSANNYLQIISSNITTINQLQLEIDNITAELNELLEEQSKANKTKEFYIAAFSNIKHNIIIYSKKFQEIENKLNSDNMAFNEFINENNFKYTFNSITSDNTDNYEFTGFSVDSNKENVITLDIPEEENISEEDSTIQELTNQFKELLKNISGNSNISDASSVLDDYISNVKNSLNIKNENIDNTYEEAEPTHSVATHTSSTPTTSNPTSSSNFSINFEFSEEDLQFIEQEKKMLENCKITEIVPTQNTIKDTTPIISNETIEVTTNQEQTIIDNTNESVFDNETIEETNISNEYVTPLVEETVTINEPDTSTKEKTISDIELLIANVKSSNTKTNVEDHFQALEATLNNIDNIINSPTLEITEPEENVIDETIDISSEISDDDLIIDMLSDEENLLKAFDDEIDIADNNISADDIVSITSRNMFNNLNLSDDDIEKKIANLLEAKNDNDDLIISEKHQKIFLPYKISELINYMQSYPNVYSSLTDVVNQEFVLPFDYFQKHPYKSRFSEAYNIIKNKEGKNIFKSMTFSLNLAKKSNLNPAIIAACKSLTELESYLYYLDSDNLKRFKFFNIIYQVNPV